MSIELGDSQIKGSLRGYSLLRKTLGSPSRALSAAPEDQQLESIKSLLKSMVGKGSTQIVQQAQTITESYTNIHGLYSEDGFLAANCKDRPPERRPALGRKRPKFSLKPKPVPSHSLPNIDFSSSIDHIDDPEEYFSAFEQRENAEKEMKKLRGEASTNSVQHHQSTTVRKRRPGLLGVPLADFLELRRAVAWAGLPQYFSFSRKTASYKHHTVADSDTVETLVESQEEHLDRRLPSSSNTSIITGPCNLFHPEPVDKPGTSPAMNTNPELQDPTVTEGSLAKKEKNVSHLLDKLLSSFKDFDGDEGKTFLRESLQMKLIDAGKICLPEMGNIQLSQHSASKNRAAHGELKSSQISPPLTKSPLTAIPTFQRRFSLKDPLKDIYSLFPSDDAPSSGDYSLCRRIQRESLSPVDVGNDDLSRLLTDDASSPVVEKGTGLGFEDGSHSPVVEADMSIGNDIVLEGKLTKHPHPSLERSPNPDFNGIVNGKGNIADGFDGGLREGHHIQLDPATDDQPDAGDEGLMLSCGNQLSRKESLDHPTQLLGENTNCDSNAGDKDKDSSGVIDGGLQAEGGDMQQDLLITNHPEDGAEVLTSNCVNQTTTEILASSPSIIMGGNCSSSRTNTETDFSGSDVMSQSKVDATVHEKASGAGMSKGIRCSPKETVHTNQHLENVRSLPDENNEEHQTVSGPPPNEGRRRKTPPRKRNTKKPNSRRQSLAGAGMIWEDGRRKSTRRRFRPLEHWRGERLLYGRIHESLSTVIGVKYTSPGKENFKVESYVSKQYADLVAQVARC